MQKSSRPASFSEINERVLCLRYYFDTEHSGYIVTVHENKLKSSMYKRMFILAYIALVLILNPLLLRCININ